MTQATIILNKAASLLLEFNELSSAGYKWEVPEHKGLFIRRIENRENQNHASNQNVAIGGANKAKFSIMAEWAGDYEVTFTHKRPWSEEKAEEKVTYKIHVPKM